jgi:hypothetical protein
MATLWPGTIGNRSKAPSTGTTQREAEWRFSSMSAERELQPSIAAEKKSAF